MEVSGRMKSTYYQQPPQQGSNPSRGCVEKTDELRDAFFNNLLIQGFDPAANEAQYMIPFNKEMFVVPNKKACEVVLYFLFNKLDPSMSRDIFRDCWPIIDKKKEMQFRKGCGNWLQRIAADDVDANFPKTVPSMLISPSGDKFYNLMLQFSQYVLLRSIKSTVKDRDILRKPIVLPTMLGMTHAIAKTIKAATIRHSEHYIKQTALFVETYKHWKLFSNEQTKEYRCLTKKIRELEHKIRVEMSNSQEISTQRGSPSKTKTRFDVDIDTSKRSDRLRNVRQLWATVSDFQNSTKNEHDVIEHILQGGSNKYRIDERQLNVHVPDLLLRECEREVFRRNVANTYEGGKLNLLSLIQLWNLSLHLYLEKLQLEGLQTFEQITPSITQHVHTHHAQLRNMIQLGEYVGCNVIPQLKRSVLSMKSDPDDDRNSINDNHNKQTPVKLNLNNSGLQLLPPSPAKVVDFEVSPDAAVKTIINQTLSTGLNKTPNLMATPEVVSRLADSINQSSMRSTAGLVQGKPTRGPADSYTNIPSRIPLASSKPGVDSNCGPFRSLAKPAMDVLGQTLTTAISPAVVSNKLISADPSVSLVDMCKLPVRRTLHDSLVLMKSARYQVDTLSSSVLPEFYHTIPQVPQDRRGSDGVRGEGSRVDSQPECQVEITEMENDLSDDDDDGRFSFDEEIENISLSSEKQNGLSHPEKAQNILEDMIADAVARSVTPIGPHSAEQTPITSPLQLALDDPTIGLTMDAFQVNDLIGRTPAVILEEQLTSMTLTVDDTPRHTDPVIPKQRPATTENNHNHIKQRTLFNPARVDTNSPRVQGCNHGHQQASDDGSSAEFNLIETSSDNSSTDTNGVSNGLYTKERIQNDLKDHMTTSDQSEPPVDNDDVVTRQGPIGGECSSRAYVKDDLISRYLRIRNSMSASGTVTDKSAVREKLATTIASLREVDNPKDSNNDISTHSDTNLFDMDWRSPGHTVTFDPRCPRQQPVEDTLISISPFSSPSIHKSSSSITGVSHNPLMIPGVSASPLVNIGVSDSPLVSRGISDSPLLTRGASESLLVNIGVSPSSVVSNSPLVSRRVSKSLVCQSPPISAASVMVMSPMTKLLHNDDISANGDGETDLFGDINAEDETILLPITP